MFGRRQRGLKTGKEIRACWNPSDGFQNWDFRPYSLGIGGRKESGRAEWQSGMAERGRERGGPDAPQGGRVWQRMGVRAEVAMEVEVVVVVGG